MDFLGDAESCKNLAQEFAVSLSKEDLAELRAELTEKSWEEWLAWRREDESMVVEYISVPPSVRRRRKEWQEPGLRRRLSLAGMRHCLEAEAFLGVIESCWVEYGGTYREIAIRAGQAFSKLLDEWISRNFFQ
ncbi:MAG: hypothetical protein HYU38_00605, partial [Candidatus Tectomicrobia bacterium]|nr:hypothetical protein [Candidatus Tectomicrobia bacterium]